MLRTLIVNCALLAVSTAGMAADVTYRKDIRPLWVKQCVECHGASTPYFGDFEENKKHSKPKAKGRAWTPTPT